MALLKLKTKISVEDYLEGEKISPVRHEFVEGKIFTMTGTSNNHNIVAGSIYSVLLIHLRDSPCLPFFGDIRVRVTKNVYYYPDVLVSCEENPKNPYFRNAPILIIEVTSPFKKRIDRREKLLFCKQMQSVQEYAVVDQHKINIELHCRQPNGSRITYFFDESDEEIEFQSVKLTLSISEICRCVRFEKNANTDDND
ncbi:Uma2 family endonuclease [soil metagenome]